MASMSSNPAGEDTASDVSGSPEAEALATALADDMICGDTTTVTMYREDWLILAEAVIEKLEALDYLVAHKGTVPTGWRGWNPMAAGGDLEND